MFAPISFPGLKIDFPSPSTPHPLSVNSTAKSSPESFMRIDSIVNYNYPLEPDFPVKFQKLDPRAITPRYGTSGAAAIDLFTYEDFELHYSNPVVVNTGIAMEIPRGYGLFIFSRSGQGFKADTRLANCVGVIDSDYRGEIKVKLTKDVASWAMPSSVKAGDAIAQGVFMAYNKATLIESNSLSETDRGSNGFGSTDAARPAS